MYLSYLEIRLKQFKVHFRAQQQKRSFRALCFIIENLHPSCAEALCYCMTLLFPARAEVLAYRVFFLWSRDAGHSFDTNCRSAIRLHPNYWYFRWILALYLRRRNSVTQAISVLGTPCPAAESFSILRLRAQLNRQQGDIEQARELAELTRKKFRQRVWPYEFLIELLLSEGCFRRAYSLAEKACSAFPGNVKLNYLAGFTAHRLAHWDRAHYHFGLALSEPPYPGHVMEAFLQSVIYKNNVTPQELSVINSYSDWALDHTADLSVVLRIANLNNEPPDIGVLRNISNAPTLYNKPHFDKLLALALLGDFDTAVSTIRQLYADGEWDLRLLAYLKFYSTELSPYLEASDLPPTSLLVENLRRSASGILAHHELASISISGNTLTETKPTKHAEDILVSIICPIHRRDDIDNIRTQFLHQRWPRLQLILCINTPDITAADFPSSHHGATDQIVIHCEPGKPVGYYLNRAIEQAQGSYILRFDADDIYAPDYVSYMIRFMQETRADLAAMDLCCFYFTEFDQTFFIRSPSSRTELNSAVKCRRRIGSGSSMCAKATLFEKLHFNEDLYSGEDRMFYYSAIESGLNFHLAPGLHHTAVRKSEKDHHTWQIDDFQLLTPSAIFLSEGPAWPSDFSAGAPQAPDDIYDSIFNAQKLVAIKELNIGQILRDTPQPLRIIVDEATPVHHISTSSVAITSKTLDAPRSGEARVVFLPANSAEELKKARELDALSVIHDIVPEILAGNRSIFRSIDCRKTVINKPRMSMYRTAKLKYAIVSNPRSGTEHFSSMLCSVGLGDPKELIRDPVASLLASSCRVEDYLPEIFSEHVSDGVLGTKIINQYLFEHFDETRLGEFFGWLKSEHFKLIRITRPFVDTATSAYIAQELGTWHYFKSRHSGANQILPDGGRLKLPEYDFEGISSHMEAHINWTDRLDHLLVASGLGNCTLDIDYESIRANPIAVVTHVANWLGYQMLPHSIPVSKTEPSTNQFSGLEQFRARFTTDWAAKETKLNT